MTLGNQVAILGKTDMRTKKIPRITKKGTTARDISAADALLTPCKMNKFIPSGGEINANSILITIMTPNQRGLNPSPTINGNNIGRVMTKIDMASKGAPNKIRKILMQRMINHGGGASDRMYFNASWASCIMEIA